MNFDPKFSLLARKISKQIKSNAIKHLSVQIFVSKSQFYWYGIYLSLVKLSDSTSFSKNGNILFRKWTCMLDFSMSIRREIDITISFHI